MRYRILIYCTLWILNASAGDAEPSVESQLRDYYAAIAKKKVDLAVSFFHPESLKIQRAKEEIEQFSEQFDISYKISEVKEIGRLTRTS